MEEDNNIHILFKQVDHSYVQKSIMELKYHMSTNPSGKISCKTASNHINTDVSDFPKYVSRNSSVSAGSTRGGGPRRYIQV